MSRTVIDITKRDNLYNLNFTCQDYEGNAVDLTGATLKLKAQLTGATTLSVDKAMSISSAIAGTCYFQVSSADFATPGIYEAEIEATFVNGQIITFSDILIKVRGDLPK